MASTRFSASLPEARQVLEFWLGDGLALGWPSESRSALWFQGGEALDLDIQSRFGSLVQEAVEGGLGPWELQPLDSLALVIVLDQFSRNVYRGQGRAFDGDARAQALVTRALESGWDGDSLPLAGIVFLYMPLMHAEDLSLQDECVRRFESLSSRAPDQHKQQLQGNLDFARQHRDIIAQFGRFPYRNAALGRENSAQEQAFLRDGPRFGQ